MNRPIIALAVVGLLNWQGLAEARVSTATGAGFPQGETVNVNILHWDTNQLPKIYERSEQLPLTGQEVVKLAKAGFDTADLVKMVEERHCACDASADGLIRLKKAGVSKKVISAISLHSLAPNRELNFLVTLDFTKKGTQAREGYLYFFVDDGKVTRVFSLNLPALLSRKNAHETATDTSDLLLTQSVRRIQLSGSIPLKTYGKHTLVVAASGKPTLNHPSQLTKKERKASQSYTFDYPRASLQSLCRLNVGYKRDVVLKHKWHFAGSRFECEWN